MDIETYSSPFPHSYELSSAFGGMLSLGPEPQRLKKSKFANKVLESIKIDNLNLIVAPYGQGKSTGVLQFLKTRLRNDRQCIQALIISPTLEHATALSDIIYDIEEDIQTAEQNFQICSGENATVDLRKLQSQPQILILTADNLTGLAQSSILNLKSVETCIIEDLEDYRSPSELRALLGQLNQAATVIATVSTFDPVILRDHLCWLKKPNLVFEFNFSELLERSQHYFVHANGIFESPDTVIQQIANQTKQKVVILCNQPEIKEIADIIGKKLDSVPLDIVDAITIRSKMLYKFRTGQSRVLITSSHFLNALSNIKCDIVINIGVPDRESSYLQRLAFSARQSATLYTISGDGEFLKTRKLMALFEKNKYVLDRPASGFQTEEFF